MKIGRQFNTFTVPEYFFYIDNYKIYSDFNTLGLYRSLLENENLSPAQKIEVRDYAHLTFKKSFDFLQLKDPATFIDVTTLGQELTKGDIENLWDNIRFNQQQIVNDKKFGHRSFGTYSKHNCGTIDCVYNGIMIRPGFPFGYYGMCIGNVNRYAQKQKSDKRRADRKNEHHIIKGSLDE